MDRTPDDRSEGKSKVQRQIAEGLHKEEPEDVSRSLEPKTTEEWTNLISSINTKNKQGNEMEIKKVRLKIVYKTILTSIFTGSILVLTLWAGLSPITAIAFLGGLAAGISLRISE